jgi:hypothetical protein
VTGWLAAGAPGDEVVDGLADDAGEAGDLGDRQAAARWMARSASSRVASSCARIAAARLLAARAIASAASARRRAACSASRSLVAVLAIG